MPSRKVKSYLEKAGIDYEVLEHDPVYTAQEVAAASHVKGKELAKAVMIKADGDQYMLVMPATRMINFEMLKENLGKKNVSLAPEEEFTQIFPDCEMGAMPPLGKLYNIKVLLDKSILDDEEIVFNAGTHHDIIKISLDDYLKLETPEKTSFTTHI